jgi:hypothetical protein
VLEWLQVQEKLAMRMMQEEERRMYDAMHEAEKQRMEARWVLRVLHHQGLPMHAVHESCRVFRQR